LNSEGRILPGYAGRNTDEADAIRKEHAYQLPRGQRRNMIRVFKVELTFEELADALDKISAIYNGRVHLATGKSPAQMVAEAKAAGQLHILTDEDEARLDLLPGADGVRQVTKRGVRIGGAFYWADEPIPWLGRRVEYVELRDQGSVAIYTTSDPAEFIAIAQNPEAVGLDRQVMA
jgi:Mu transposase, C-terminal